MRPRVPLEACLASFSGPEEIPDFYSTALNSKTTASKYAHFEPYNIQRICTILMKAQYFIANLFSNALALCSFH